MHIVGDGVVVVVVLGRCCSASCRQGGSVCVQTCSVTLPPIMAGWPTPRAAVLLLFLCNIARPNVWLLIRAPSSSLRPEPLISVAVLWLLWTRVSPSGSVLKRVLWFCRKVTAEKYITFSMIKKYI